MTTPPLDLPALKNRVESTPPNGESAMKGMAFPAVALPELWTLRHIARVDAPALLEYAEANRKGWGELLNDFARMEDRATAAEAAIARVREVSAKHVGVTPMPSSLHMAKEDVALEVLAALDGGA